MDPSTRRSTCHDRASGDFGKNYVVRTKFPHKLEIKIDNPKAM